jgi:hypothetical protein
MSTIRRLLGLSPLLLATACVSNPSNIQANYVNPAQYRSMTCEEVGGELQRVSAREADLTARQQTNYETDVALVSVGVVLFWPALLAMPATTDYKSQIAQLRGEREALERSTNRCTSITTASGTAVPATASAAVMPAN